MRPDDLSQLERFHQAQGFAYEMPNLADPLYFIKMVGEQDGKIVNACVAHLTAEMYFLADKKAGDPEQRFNNFVTMHDAISEVAYRQGGLSDFFCWVPPQVARPFGRRLLKLGWKRPLWTCFAKELGK